VAPRPILEVAEVVRINEEGYQAHREALIATRRSKRCMRESDVGVASSKKAWFRAVEEEKKSLTPDEKASMAALESAIHCVKSSLRKVDATNRDLAALTKQSKASTRRWSKKRRRRLRGPDRRRLFKRVWSELI
jgi:hypothetical protein